MQEFIILGQSKSQQVLVVFVFVFILFWCGSCETDYKIHMVLQSSKITMAILKKMNKVGGLIPDIKTI